jgi:hypothetical protein
MPPDKAGTVSGGLTKSTLSPVRSSKPNENSAFAAEAAEGEYHPLFNGATGSGRANRKQRGGTRKDQQVELYRIEDGSNQTGPCQTEAQVLKA